MKNHQLLIFLCLALIVSALEQTKNPAQFYNNDRSMQYITNVLTQSKIFTKGKCSNQPAYPFMDIDSKKAQYFAIIVCNVHARQLIVSQICLKWLDSLNSHPEITQKMSFKVFYRANRMRDEARTVEGQCRRTNQNKVDPNRNFPTQFNFYNATENSQIYPSDRPINQPFTVCLNESIEQRKPDFFLDLHSGESAFYYQEGINNEQEISILKNLNSTYPDLNVSKITTLKKDGQSINGHIFADLKVRKQVAYSLLFETFDGGEQNHETVQENCFRQFNPVTPEHLQKAQNVWTNAINLAITQVISALDKDTKK